MYYTASLLQSTERTVAGFVPLTVGKLFDQLTRVNIKHALSFVGVRHVGKQESSGLAFFFNKQ